jgi:hypothetical protein
VVPQIQYFQPEQRRDPGFLRSSHVRHAEEVLVDEVLRRIFGEDI